MFTVQASMILDFLRLRHIKGALSSNDVYPAYSTIGTSKTAVNKDNVRSHQYHKWTDKLKICKQN